MDWQHLRRSPKRLKPICQAIPGRDADQSEIRPRVLSLGAGVQSSALLLLAAEGKIAPFDVAIFADTGWEPATVYDHLQRLIDEVARPAGIPVVRVSNGNIREDSISVDYSIMLPLFLMDSAGNKGMLNRQCTQNYKLLPIYRYVRLMLGAEITTRECKKCNGTGRRHLPQLYQTVGRLNSECSVCRGSGLQQRVGPIPDPSVSVDMAIGFSVDEVFRVGTSRRKYVNNIYPLLDMSFTRADAAAYLATRGFSQTPRSACIGCPYHSEVEWQGLREKSPSEWEDALLIDDAIRAIPQARGMRGHAFLHRSCKPLRELDLRSERNLQSEARVEILGCSPFGCRSDTGLDVQSEVRLLDLDEE